tara:strand:- start:4009 stop:4158 length:150 start_codon:yes stop_codon:yes gene_type:complete
MTPTKDLELSKKHQIVKLDSKKIKGFIVKTENDSLILSKKGKQASIPLS